MNEDFILNENPFDGGCPTAGLKRCEIYKFDCTECWKQHYLSFIRAATSGIVQVSTQKKIIGKAEKLLESPDLDDNTDIIDKEY